VGLASALYYFVRASRTQPGVHGPTSAVPSPRPRPPGGLPGDPTPD
jgi:hypothetical protein